MIDKNTGHLSLDFDKTILPTTTLNEIKIFNLGEVQEEKSLGNGWVHYTVRNLEKSGRFFNMTFFFHKEALESISFVINGSPINLDGGWALWNEKRERENVILYNDWLTKEIGTGRSFSWGNIWATYDPKTGGSSIGIRYK